MKTDKIPGKQEYVLQLYIRLLRATSSVTKTMRRYFNNHRLSVSQFAVLEALYHIGPLCQREIGRNILKTHGNITVVIKNLLSRELVLREKDPMDRRKVNVALTVNGRRLIESILPDHEEIAFQKFSILDLNEQRTLSELLRKIGPLPNTETHTKSISK